MAKKKISVALDEQLVEHRLERHAALGDLLERWESLLGPIDERERADVQATLAEADGDLDQWATA